MPEPILRLFLVRHGITAWNRAMRFQGHTDISLDEEGEAQARRIAARLARLPLPLEAIYSSDLLRAWRTAEAIAAPAGMTVRTTPLLRETGLGAWEGLTREEIIARGEEAHLERYRRDSIAHRPPEGETLAAAGDRMRKAVSEIRAQHPAGQVVIVGHGGSLRLLICEALNAPLTTLHHFWLENTSLSIIEERTELGQTVQRLALLNDTSHLDTL